MKPIGTTFRYLNSPSRTSVRVEVAVTAVDAEERDYISGGLMITVRTMADQKRSWVWLHFSKIDVDYARCNICDAKCKASHGNTTNLRNHLIKHKIFLKADKCTIFKSFKTQATMTPTADTVAAGGSSPAASIAGEDLLSKIDVDTYDHDSISKASSSSTAPGRLNNELK